jgi:hypothetical protein
MMRKMSGASAGATARSTSRGVVSTEMLRKPSSYRASLLLQCLDPIAHVVLGSIIPYHIGIGNALPEDPGSLGRPCGAPRAIRRYRIRAISSALTHKECAPRSGYAAIVIEYVAWPPADRQARPRRSWRGGGTRRAAQALAPFADFRQRASSFCLFCESPGRFPPKPTGHHAGKCARGRYGDAMSSKTGGALNTLPADALAHARRHKRR